MELQICLFLPLGEVRGIKLDRERALGLRGTWVHRDGKNKELRHGVLLA